MRKRKIIEFAREDGRISIIRGIFNAETSLRRRWLMIRLMVRTEAYNPRTLNRLRITMLPDLHNPTKYYSEKKLVSVRYAKKKVP